MSALGTHQSICHDLAMPIETTVGRIKSACFQKSASTNASLIYFSLFRCDCTRSNASHPHTRKCIT